MESAGRSFWRALVLAALVMSLTPSVHALLIMGGRERQRRKDWSPAVERVANLDSRVAWFEGPRIGRKTDFEYQGDAAALTVALKALAEIEGPRPRVVVTDDRRISACLRAKPEIDWTFVYWEKTAFLVYDKNRQIVDPGTPIPTPEFRVYLGNGLEWSKVVVPAGVDLVDERLSARGYRPEDGGVLEMTVVDSRDGTPLKAAELKIERTTPVDGDPTGVEVTRAESNGEGRIMLTMLPRETLSLTLERKGFLSLSLGPVHFGNTPCLVREVRMTPSLPPYGNEFSPPETR
ncbi:hypothetical protein Pan44_08660 [Caulifigura coniformis]|uniref:Carboxypeptidase regulatory-like domain-containing protein n=1 Tax=Caulifigura coniformis TaxID=2527983 RepID=A0A517S9R0_9PLAN|nr:hypothetical protein [Caulifigura coniformis]QDT52853.1 hypothetical protein Pan44_08660 [Caulifigura coniformis]